MNTDSVRSEVRRRAALGVAAATVATLTVAAAPAPVAFPPALHAGPGHAVSLAAASYTSFFPEPGAWGDITGGLANAVYHAGQDVVGTVLPAIVNAINLSAIGKAGGLDLTGIIGQIPKTLLPQILDALPLNLAPLLRQSLGLVGDALVPVLQALGVMDGSGNIKLTTLLGLVGLNVDNLLNIGGPAVDGINVVTAGPVFTLAKMIGIDLGWTPGTADAIAKAVDGTSYLHVGIAGLITTVLDRAEAALPLLDPLVVTLKSVIEAVDLSRLDLIGIRVPLTVGFGLGAFALGQAYDQIVQGLANGPDGVNNRGANILGGLTIMPEVLLNNLGRANGGLLARFYPFGDLLGINTVTPDVNAVHSGQGLDVLGTGIALGASNLLPVKVDATLEYQPFSDLAAWPNPFSLLNNLIAGTEPSYLLRGISTDTLAAQLETAVGAVTGSILSGDPLAANIYLTIPTATLPLLEPLYLAGDVLNMVTFGTVGRIFTGLANALAPAISSLVNLGYTDVVRNADGTYTRTLDQAGRAVPFFSLPNIDWSRVPGDIVHDLQVGLTKEFFSGNPTPAPPNVITALVSLLTGGRVDLSHNPLAGPLSALANAVTTLVNNVTGALRGLVGGSAAAAAAVPSTTATLIELPARAAAAVKDSSSLGPSGRPVGAGPNAEDHGARHAARMDRAKAANKGDEDSGGRQPDKRGGHHGTVSVGPSGGPAGTARHAAGTDSNHKADHRNSGKHQRSSGRHAA